VPINLPGITFHFVEDVDLVGANNKHLEMAGWEDCDESRELLRTIIPLTWVSPAVWKEPVSPARAGEAAANKERSEGISIVRNKIKLEKSSEGATRVRYGK
jgi:hypothetical protein